MSKSEIQDNFTDVTLALEDYQQSSAHKVILIPHMENICEYYSCGYCKYKEQCKKNHVKEECDNGINCHEKETCKLRHPKICKRMINYGYCRYGVKCAYKHNHIKNSYGEDAIEDIKNIKAELDVLKNTVKALMSIKEEGKSLQKDVKCLKEDIKLLIAVNKDTADRISQLQDECVYDTEEDEEEAEVYEAQNRFEDFEDLFQIESVEGEVIYACNVCDKGLDTEDDIKKHLKIHQKEILQSIRKESEDDLENPDQGIIVCAESNSDKEEAKAMYSYTCKACVVLGLGNCVSSNDKEINDHLFYHLEMSKAKEVEAKKRKEELNLDDEDIYAGFDEDGNRIV